MKMTSKSKIKILHLYHDLMNLYGDWGNAAVLERELIARGCEVVVNKMSVGDVIEFDAFDFICIGSGTERSQIACMRDLVRYKDVLFERINAGVPMLATGNSHELFGLAVTDCDGNRHEMLGLLEFETVQQSTRVTGDCVCKASFIDNKLIGFINRAGGHQQGDVERPFSIEPREGANYSACTEGIRYKNLLGTYLTGPILFRNPPLLKFFADLLTDAKRESNDLFFDFQEKAFEVALSEL